MPVDASANPKTFFLGFQNGLRNSRREKLKLAMLRKRCGDGSLPRQKGPSPFPLTTTTKSPFATSEDGPDS